ncbi:TetR/AcrR family transcriptional regulator [Variovorax sp. Root411]|uniref:TetR/AcrR family transcriptional regulator n=1 Tax=Variovorax sp. Root411 TaxID=1736530 RepID=UPI00070136B5|nr:TetR/AcrR family transcriptional regulator [Variovorax sp. Root411]KQW64949.1 TetR family transcriptional regulator [Variovorax sp. Root411]
MARPQEFNTAEALHKALGVFWRKGYEGTSMADLLLAMGLSKSSLYGTFGGKRELFIAAFDAYREDRARDMHRILAQGLARGAIETFFRMIIDDASSEEFSCGCMSINQAVEMAPRDPEIRARVVEDFQTIESDLARTIKRGHADGSVKSTKGSQELAQLLLLAFPGLQVMVRAGCDKTWLDNALSLLLSNLD